MIQQRLLASTFAFLVALGPLPASAQLFGPSDEEKAREAAQDSGLQDLQGRAQQQDARIRGLEDKVRGLTDSLSQSTGANEELNHQLQLQNDKIDRMQKDFAYRLCTLSAQQLGAGDSINCAAAGTTSAGLMTAQPYSSLQRGMRPGDSLPPIDATGNNIGNNNGFAPPPDNGPPVRGRPPGTLGTLPMNSGPSPLNGSLAGPAPASNPAQYDQAMNLMSRAQYNEAAAAFRGYADANPGDTDLSPQAIYWVGNISFIRQDYAPAARTFAEVIKKYPKSQRAPDAMLKLAQSFMAMGQKTEGCTTLGLIKTKYPNGSPQTLASAASLRKPPAASKFGALEKSFAAALKDHAGPPWAVAVSGGSDSLALMHLLAAFARANTCKAPVVLTVDHGLRVHSARDARQVAAWAKTAGLTAHVLTWRGTKPKSGIEAAAREARYRLMGAWLVKHEVATLFVGHTQDDQAETFLLRLARGSGLDGLAAMRARAPWPVPGFAGLAVARPLLGQGREVLRAYLKQLGQDWLDDPMNDDEAFDRVKIRKARDVLAGAGLSSARIAAAAMHLARARESLEIVTEAVLDRAVCKLVGTETGLWLNPLVLAAAPREVGLRALASVLMAVGGQAYRPRFESLERLFAQIVAGELRGGATLHGCHIRPATGKEKDFAPFSLVVRSENPRKSTGSASARL